MKPVCVPCERFMRPLRNGFYFIEGKPYGDPNTPWDGSAGKHSVGWTPYKVWLGDLWGCPDCDAQIVVGVARTRLTEHYEPDFANVIARTGAAQLLVKDC